MPDASSHRSADHRGTVIVCRHDTLTVNVADPECLAEQ